MSDLVLTAHVCSRRGSYKVVFDGADRIADERAARFIRERQTTHAFELSDEGRPPDQVGIDMSRFPLTADLLFPTCEHGLSARLCAGPDHYPSREQETTWEVG